MNFDDGNPHIFSMDSNVLNGFGVNYLSHLCSLVDFSLLNSNHLVISGSGALQEAFNCISKFAGALFIWLSTCSNPGRGRKILRSISRGSNIKNHKACSEIKHIARTNKIKILPFFSGADLHSVIPFVFSKFANSTATRLWKEFGSCQAFPVLSLAAALVPPFENLSAKVLSDSIQLGMVGDQIGEHVFLQNKEEGNQVCDTCIIPGRTLSRDAVEPKTGISFPTVLDKPLSGEVLVGMGFRSMKIIKFKSLKIYAFGLYVHFGSICKKLGHKYASVSAIELKDCSDFYEDLLREDVGLTVRLVVNCSGLKINSVRDAFEKSLRARLLKMNPNTDYECLSVFGSYFMEDIPLPIGTTIDFRRTTDGRLITEIGGRHIGAVQSKDLCRAFFDMYIGDVPVSHQVKQDMAENIARLIRKC
ncbi:fatty-acid-binding protein 2 isoform X2 [Phalaenopsis equestris]|uniref:fatty-acid-binding protein 2 isoform X2 n=1 Tax=Phalaenopsis equestris TaxID=78828 RepID=UPI0009E63127|nr:fatty-acid-binding protein 2 isoform X2 [Phalaenopsis equestris]